MSTSLAACARLLGRAGVRHHVDHDQHVIRVVFLTRSYQNLRGERLIIVTVAVPEDGRSCHARIDRAFAWGDDPAVTCLAACRLARETPGLAVTADEPSATISIGMTIMLEGARLTTAQLLAMLDVLVAAAESLHGRLTGKTPRRGFTSARTDRRHVG